MRRSLPAVVILLILCQASHLFARSDAWIEVRSPHFVVISNGGAKDVTHLADQFERMRLVFNRAFPTVTVDPAAPIVVIAVKDRKDFQTLEPRAYLAKGSLNIAGLFLRTPDKNYVLLRMDAEGDHPYSIVYHEYTHLLLSHDEEWLPLWLNEGLAQFYENTEIQNKEAELGRPSLGNLELLRQSSLLPLTTIFTVDRNSPYYHEENKGSMFYAESWALTHYLLIKDFQNKSKMLSTYAALVSSHVDSVTAATRAFGDLKELQHNLQNYVAQGSFNFVRMPGTIEVDDAQFKTRTLTLNEADAARADLLAHNEREADARPLLDRILQTDPNNVLANETMGYLAFLHGQLDAAEKWYGQAVRLDSQSYLANYYFAAMAEREQPSDARDAQIEASLHAAIKLNPSFAPSYGELAIFYAKRHRNLDEAHMLSLRAIQLDPSHLGYRLNAATIQMELQNPQNAIAVLQQALKIARNPQESAMVQSEIDAIQRFVASGGHFVEQPRETEENHADESISIDQPPVLRHTPRSSESQDSAPPAEVQGAQATTPRGPQRTATGTIHGVHCTARTVLVFTLEGSSKALQLKSSNYFRVSYSALNFTPTADMDPCKDLEGAKAKVQYFESAAGSGEVTAIEISR